MNDLKSMKGLLIRAPSTTYPSLIMCNGTLSVDPALVLTILLKIGSHGLMVGVTNEYVAVVKPRMTELTQLADEPAETLKAGDEDACGSAQEEVEAADKGLVIPPVADLLDIEEPGAEGEQAAPLIP